MAALVELELESTLIPLFDEIIRSTMVTLPIFIQI